MATPVYSERFCAVSAPGIWNYFTVPAGHRAIVRCITVTVIAGTPAAVYVAVGPTYLTAKPYPASTALVLGEYRVPIYAGESIGLQTAGSECFATVSGYLFKDPPTAGVLPAPEPPVDPDWPPPPPFDVE